jgi:TPR repeat protein
VTQGSTRYDFSDEERRQLERYTVLFESGDGEGCKFLLKRMVADGKHSALCQLGFIYEVGCGGIQRDFPNAAKWYKQSIEAIDDINSHRGLARIYLQEFQLDPDHSLAKYHLDHLVYNEVMGGYFGLGYLYQKGLGVPKDFEKAAQFYKKAADMGHIVAQSGLNEIANKGKLRNFLSIFSAFRKSDVPIGANGTSDAFTI